MTKKGGLSIWMPVEPQRVLEQLRLHGVASVPYIESCEKDLANMGYRFDPQQLARLREATERYCAEWDSILDSMRVEHVGPPKGKVPPPGAIEYHQRTGKCLVTRDDDDPPNESRSRH